MPHTNTMSLYLLHNKEVKIFAYCTPSSCHEVLSLSLSLKPAAVGTNTTQLTPVLIQVLPEVQSRVKAARLFCSQNSGKTKGRTGKSWRHNKARKRSKKGETCKFIILPTLATGLSPGPDMAARWALWKQVAATLFFSQLLPQVASISPALPCLKFSSSSETRLQQFCWAKKSKVAFHRPKSIAIGMHWIVPK